MKYLNVKYKLFESEINGIIEKCKTFKIEKFYIDDCGMLTVWGDVNLNNRFLKKIPLKFKEVYGNFDISYNDIISLFGSPIIVEKNFMVSYTKIKNLKYSPIEIGLDLYCVNNKNLINIRHFPKIVGCSILLYESVNLKSLYGCLNFVNGCVNVDWCTKLVSLKYSPQTVVDFYTCQNCLLTSLYGAPKNVGSHFNCSFNRLNTLKYSPNNIGGNFIFEYNKISSFDYFPEYVGENIFCGDNPVARVWRLFRDKNYIDYFNQMKIISDGGKKINIKRLNVFLKSIGKDTVEYVEGYENI